MIATVEEGLTYLEMVARREPAREAGQAALLVAVALRQGLEAETGLREEVAALRAERDAAHAELLHRHKALQRFVDGEISGVKLGELLAVCDPVSFARALQNTLESELRADRDRLRAEREALLLSAQELARHADLLVRALASGEEGRRELGKARHRPECPSNLFPRACTCPPCGESHPHFAEATDCPCSCHNLASGEESKPAEDPLLAPLVALTAENLGLSVPPKKPGE